MKKNKIKEIGIRLMYVVPLVLFCFAIIVTYIKSNQGSDNHIVVKKIAIFPFVILLYQSIRNSIIGDNLMRC